MNMLLDEWLQLLDHTDEWIASSYNSSNNWDHKFGGN